MPNFLTKEGLKKLKKELQELKGIKRSEIAERLKEAASFGDLSENMEYQETKEAQAFIEGRILELESLINEAVIVQRPTAGNKDTVSIGSIVRVADRGGEDNFTIVGTFEAAPEEGKISHESPLGKAFLGKKKNDIITVEAPGGKVEYRIIRIS